LWVLGDRPGGWGGGWFGLWVGPWGAGMWVCIFQNWGEHRVQRDEDEITHCKGLSHPIKGRNYKMSPREDLKFHTLPMLRETVGQKKAWTKQRTSSCDGESEIENKD